MLDGWHGAGGEGKRDGRIGAYEDAARGGMVALRRREIYDGQGCEDYGRIRGERSGKEGK